MKKGIKKLQLEKIKITKLANLNSIKGGSTDPVLAGNDSNNAIASGCICTVTLALSDQCEPDDYETDLCTGGAGKLI